MSFGPWLLYQSIHSINSQRKRNTNHNGYLPWESAQLFAVEICRGFLPWEFAAAICRVFLPWGFALGICCSYLLWEFAAAICRGFVLCMKAKLFSMWSNPFSVQTKIFNLKEAFFSCEKNFLYLWKSFYLCAIAMAVMGHLKKGTYKQQMQFYHYYFLFNFD